MKIRSTSIQDVVVVESQPFEDHRGSFCRLFCERGLETILGGRRIVQVNHSRTIAVGTIRGMHYQLPPHAEMKMVRCLKGRVWDVAVDLRAESPTFLKWHAEELIAGNSRMLVIPEGCAHGFQVLETESELVYFSTAFYNGTAEGGVRYDDPLLVIDWPLPVTDLSSRDQQHPFISYNFKGIVT